MSKLIQLGFALLLIGLVLFIFMWIGIFVLDLVNYIEQYGVYGFFFWPIIRGNQWNDWFIQIIWFCALVGTSLVLIGAIKAIFGTPLFSPDFEDEAVASKEK